MLFTESNEEKMLEKALAMSMDSTAASASAGASSTPANVSRPLDPDFSNMTEDEQIAYAMQMSLHDSGRKNLIHSMHAFQLKVV